MKKLVENLVHAYQDHGRADVLWGTPSASDAFLRAYKEEGIQSAMGTLYRMHEGRGDTRLPQMVRTGATITGSLLNTLGHNQKLRQAALPVATAAVLAGTSLAAMGWGESIVDAPGYFVVMPKGRAENYQESKMVNELRGNWRLLVTKGSMTRGETPYALYYLDRWVMRGKLLDTLKDPVGHMEMEKVEYGKLKRGQILDLTRWRGAVDGLGLLGVMYKVDDDEMEEWES